MTSKALRPMVIALTGTSKGMTSRQQSALRILFDSLPMRMFIHGGCIGADTQAHDLAIEDTAAKVHVWPGVDDRGDMPKAGRNDWGRAVVHPPRPYLHRNRILVSMCDLLIVAPAEITEQPRGGTWYTFRHARQERKMVLMLWP